MKASELLVRCLENEGVRYIFGVPGEENLEFMEALSHSTQITFVTTRHEQGAAFMANVYGRLSTYPGVCLATLGPGATNLVTGIADAFLDRAPLVAITGDGGFLMNSQELETAKRLGTAFVTVIWTDNRYGIIALNQERRFGRTFGAALLRNGLPKPDTMISAYCSAICLVHSATSIRPCHGVFAMLVRFSAASHGSGIFDQNSVQCSKYCCLCRVCSSNRAVVSRKNAWTIFPQ